MAGNVVGAATVEAMRAGVISLAICWIITSVTSLRGSTRRLTSRRRPGQYGLTGIKMAGAASARPLHAAYIILTPGVILE